MKDLEYIFWSVCSAFALLSWMHLKLSGCISSVAPDSTATRYATRITCSFTTMPEMTSRSPWWLDLIQSVSMPKVFQGWLALECCYTCIVCIVRTVYTCIYYYISYHTCIILCTLFFGGQSKARFYINFSYNTSIYCNCSACRWTAARNERPAAQHGHRHHHQIVIISSNHNHNHQDHDHNDNDNCNSNHKDPHQQQQQPQRPPQDQQQRQ